MLNAITSWLLNPFSSVGLQALPWAFCAAVLTYLVFRYFNQERKTTLFYTGGVFLVAMWIEKLYIFEANPAQVGFLGGYSAQLEFCLLLLAGTCWIGSGRKRLPDYRDYPQRQDTKTKAKQGRRFGLLVKYAGIVAFFIQALVFFVTAFLVNTQTAVKVQNAHVAIASNSDKVPSTDPNHIPLVSQQQAYKAGRQVIAKAGPNLGSLYKTNESDYTLQNVRHHLWWVAPLVYVSDFSQFQLFGKHQYESPGYIRVDAENPNAPAEPVVGLHIHYAMDAWYDNNVVRYLYSHGYDHGQLDDPTMEIDDNGRPYITVAYTQPELIMTADKLVKTILLDVQTGEIRSYNPGEEPGWVDRVISLDMVNALATDWARNYSAPFINPSGNGEMKPAGPAQLVYAEAGNCVWMVLMTSKNTSDDSATGLWIYQTKVQQGEFYPGVNGIGVGDSIEDDFEKVKENLQHYPVVSVQPYMISNTLTYVAIYDSAPENGSFAGIAFLDARRPNAASVIFASDEKSALANYLNWLAINPYSNGSTIGRFGRTSGDKVGTITRIGWVTRGDVPTYFLLIAGDSHTFSASTALNGSLPLMREGDKVRYSFLKINEPLQTLTSLTDLTINR
jgi:hypothetical protein